MRSAVAWAWVTGRGLAYIPNRENEKEEPHPDDIVEWTHHNAERTIYDFQIGKVSRRDDALEQVNMKVFAIFTSKLKSLVILST